MDVIYVYKSLIINLLMKHIYICDNYDKDDCESAFSYEYDLVCNKLLKMSAFINQKINKML